MKKQHSQQIREDMVRIGKSFFDRALSGGASGNMSAALDDGTWLVSPTGLSLGALTCESLSHVDAQGQLLSGLPPTKEIHIHRAVYAVRPQCRAIVHLHSTYATALSCCPPADVHDVVPAYTPYGLMRYGKVGLSPYAAPGSQELLDFVQETLKSHAAALLSNHGQLMTGKSLTDAANNAEELEESCRLCLLLRGCNASALALAAQDYLLRTYQP